MTKMKPFKDLQKQSVKKVNLRIIILCRSQLLFMGDHDFKKSYIIFTLDFINFSPLVSNSFNIRNEILYKKHINIDHMLFINSYHLLPRKKHMTLKNLFYSI